MPPRKSYTTARRNNWNCYRTTTCRTPKHNLLHATTYPCNSPKFRIVKTECQWRMGSYLNVYSQFTGTGRHTNMSPTTANRWIRYVNCGNQIYRFSNRDFCNNWGKKWTNANARPAYQYLRRRYGAMIKDVTRGKNNCWLIACTRTPTARPFTSYNWY